MDKKIIKEFIIQYTWAIIIILASIGALAYFNVVKHDNPSDCDRYCERHNTSQCAFESNNQYICYVEPDKNWTKVFDKGVENNGII